MPCTRITRTILATMATILLMASSSTSNPIQNELLEALTMRLDSLQIKVDLLEQKNAENEVKILKQEREIIQLKSRVGVESDHATGPAHDGSVNNKIESLSDSRPSRAVVPSSCRDLSLIGHSLEGLYLIKNPDTKKIETVLCTFETSVSQEFIGNVDIKTKSVHFYVQREYQFSTQGAIVPFDLAPLNEGEAMNIASGIFTAPVPGIYHFEFSGIKDNEVVYVEIFLQVNGVNVGVAATYPYDVGTYDSISLSASLRLNANDRVNLYLNNIGCAIFDNSNHMTHFSGWLVEEDSI